MAITVPKIKSKESRYLLAAGQVGKIQPNPHRINLYVWNNSSFDARFSFDKDVDSAQSPLIYANAADEFTNNSEIMQFTPDSKTIGSGTCELIFYEEYVAS